MQVDVVYVLKIKVVAAIITFLISHFLLISASSDRAAVTQQRNAFYLICNNVNYFIFLSFPMTLQPLENNVLSKIAVDHTSSSHPPHHFYLLPPQLQQKGVEKPKLV